MNIIQYFMDIQTLAKADLNALLALYVVYEEGSVARAADRLHLTPSAISKSLARNRDRFEDPLFTRSGNHLIPTPFLKNMIPRLEMALDGVVYALQPAAFDPQTFEGKVELSFSETVDLVLLPRLLTYLRTAAPGISVFPRHYTSDTLEDLANGELDFVISLEYTDYPENYTVDKFLTANHALLGRVNHPLRRQSVSITDVTAYPRVGIKLPDFERTLQQYTLLNVPGARLDWELYLETDTLLSAISVLKVTDCLLAVPHMLARELAKEQTLRSYSLKDYDHFKLNYMTISHQRVARSPMHQWFRQVLALLGQEIGETA